MRMMVVSRAFVMVWSFARLSFFRAWFRAVAFAAVLRLLCRLMACLWRSR